MVSPSLASPSDPIRVLIVDDHMLFRRGLQMVLSVEDDIQIVGEAEDGVEAVSLAESLMPDIILMDVRMPRGTGIEACRAISASTPSVKIVMLTISDEESDLFDAVRAGARGYLLKDIPGEEIADGIRSVMDGQSLISPSMASALLTEFASMKKAEPAQPRTLSAPRLTERELQVLKLVAQGLVNREIAEELHISENTVKNHVRNILDKLQLHSRMEAVVYAVRENILQID